jgi:hypothetical protein
MANELKSTNLTGTLAVVGAITLNGVPVGAAEAAAGLAGIAIRDILGAPDDATWVIGGGPTTTVLKVTAQSSPNLTVQVARGTCFIAGVHAGITSALASLGGFAAPSANPRIDIVQMSNAGVISRKAGTEAGSPTAPTADAGNMVIAEVYNRVGQTSIKNTDDSTNGYITDRREWQE